MPARAYRTWTGVWILRLSFHVTNSRSLYASVYSQNDRARLIHRLHRCALSSAEMLLLVFVAAKEGRRGREDSISVLEVPE